ncbi:peroxiredoxin [Sulfuriflexus mobilis]|uniref:peroxiredoxin n=1 Tax=Sulfuriflexus mobilis TaxID=1811807 RepID=UPI000F844D9A|nr:peroxiredoxin [Sulfuriflexus mobilis]
MSTGYFLPIGLFLLALLLLAILVLRSAPASAGPVVGEDAPAFDLLDQNSQRQRLEDYRGQWLVLYFYPKDDTPGCTAEACQFRDEYYRIKALGAVVMGVSLDDLASHKAFAAKYHLPFSLLADGEKKFAAAYGVLSGFGPIKFARRQSFIIDPQGRIARHYARVSPRQHAGEILRDLQALQKQSVKTGH